MDALLEKKRKKYGKDRNNEPDHEPALIHADHIDYLESNKGAIALYHLLETIGFEAANRSLLDWLEEQHGKPLVFIDFYNYLKADHLLDQDIIQHFESVEDDWRI